ncbi:transglycosylase-like protein with SLT domain [Modicisalibacter xianhensis]|uniref:Transglycosylase-like protein with SLT domain n=2 Tax=Modicisalibacter xianhensis TaxID=442341 RepID=A0A4R8FYR5_9GAMM|nr:transglycosylase-like protein with SLT domain [Halomonas xianhensis]
MGLLMAAFLFLSPAMPARAAAQVPEKLSPTLLATLGNATAALPFDAPPESPTRIWIARRHASLARFIPQPEQRSTLLARVQAEAALAGLAPDIVLAVIQVESGFDAQAISSAGAQGLMQVMPFWKEVIGRSADDLLEPGLNLRYGCTILAHYLALENGDLTRALARYNGSLGQTWYPERVMQSWVEYWWTPHYD